MVETCAFIKFVYKGPLNNIKDLDFVTVFSIKPIFLSNSMGKTPPMPIGFCDFFPFVPKIIAYLDAGGNSPYADCWLIEYAGVVYPIFKVKELFPGRKGLCFTFYDPFWREGKLFQNSHLMPKFITIFY